VSVTATTHGNIRRHQHPGESIGIRAYFLAATLVTIALLAFGLTRDWHTVANEVPALLIWAAVAAVGDLLPVPLWGDVSLSMSLPVTLSAGMVLTPWAAGLVAFVAALDSREFRREISLPRGLYNRAQVTACVILSSLVFHALGGSVSRWPSALVLGVLALVVDWAANSVLVMVPVALMARLSTREVVRRVHGEEPIEHTAGYLCLGLLAAPLGAVYVVAGGWGLVSALIPLTLARQMFVRGRRLEESARRLAAKDRALVTSIEQTLFERRDERLAVAGELHDEVLPPLFKVHLMGQVLRQDLNSGRLLDLDVDLPELLSAAEAAQTVIRDLMRDLRQSSLGPAGLNATLELLARQLETAGSPPITLDLQDVGGSSACQLLAYQVAREALNNAARHSRASKISVRLLKDAGLIRLVVSDDGIGFDPALVDRDEHFGLQLIAERVEAGRGRVVIDSQLGRGTSVMATLAPEIS
jgi:signal transduction histidine kinase